MKYFNNIKHAAKYVVNFINYLCVSKRFDLECLKGNNLRDKLNKPSIFIIGSGKSINKITEERWNFIQEKSSIGFNGSIFHTFQPSVYFTYISDDENVNLEMALIDALVEWMKGKSTLLILKNIYKSSMPMLHKLRIISKKNRFNMKSIFDLPGEINDVNNLSKTIELYDKLRILNNDFCYLSFRSSIVTALSLAASQRPKEIIILGCDLINSCYFWEDIVIENNNKILIKSSTAKLISKHSPAINDKKIHNTANVSISEVTLQAVLKELIPIYEFKYNTKIYIYPHNPILPYIDEYKWPY